MLLVLVEMYTYRVVPRTNHTPITRNRDTRHTNIILGNQLMTTLILSQIPDPDIAAPIATNQLALIWMNDYIIDRDAVCIIPLYIATPSVPNLDGAVLGRRDKPLGLAVEGDAGDVASVSIEGKDCVGIGRLDVVELYRMMAGGGEVAFVGRDTEAVYLRVWVGDGAGADAREGFPEALSRD